MCRHHRSVPWVGVFVLGVVVQRGVIAAEEGPQPPEGALACRTLTLPRQALLGPSALSSDRKFLVGLLPDKQLVGVWTLADGHEVRSFRGAGPADSCLALSPDGKAVAAGTLGGKVVLWDLATGKERHAWRHPDQPLAKALAFAPDGRALAAGLGPGGPVRVWDTASGKEVYRLEGFVDVVSSLVFSPDGKTLAAVAPEAQAEYARLWDAGGKEVRLFRERVSGVAFSPDGEVLATADGTGSVNLWPVAPGHAARLLRSNGVLARHLVFSPDGRMLASWSDVGSPLCLWEVASGQVVRRFKMSARRPHHPASSIVAVGFAPDGRALITVGCEGVVVWWDVTGLGREGLDRPVKLHAVDLEDLWATTGSGDAAEAHRAVWALTTGHRDAIPFLQERLRTLLFVERRIERAIRDLDARSFAVRTRAVRELKVLGEAARPALSRVLASQPSLEMRKRIEELLEEGLGPGPAELKIQVIRGVQVLEQSGTLEARRALEKLAREAREETVQAEARKALTRLGGQKRKP